MVRICHKCRKEIPHTERILRSEECPWCLSALHACKNCRFWDEGAHNQCREVGTAPVRDREAANYCGAFEFVAGERDDAESEVSKAKSKLDGLFKI